MDYKQLVDQFELKKGDKIWLSSELIRLVLKFKKENIAFDASLLIDEFQKSIGETGTLIIPTFSFEFSNHGFYDRKNTPGTTGALGNIALQRGDFIRTKHPMHSFAVWGEDLELLTNMENKHAFGMDSPFGYCLGKHVKQIILGTDYVHAMTFVHYAEATCNVPYRFAKEFTGTYIDLDGKEEIRTYQYAARKLEIEPTETFNKIGEILEKEGASKKIIMDGLTSYKIDLAKSYPVICKDIVENACANIYDFNIPRKDIFIYE